MWNKITAGLSVLFRVENNIVWEIAFQVRHLLLHVAYTFGAFGLWFPSSQEELNWFSEVGVAPMSSARRYSAT